MRFLSSCLVVSVLSVSSAACSSEATEEEDLSSDAVQAGASNDTGYPALVSEKDFPVALVRALKDRAKTSSVKLAASRAKGTLSASAVNQGKLLVVGVVATQGNKQTLIDLRAFSRGPGGLELVKYAALANAVAAPGKAGAQVLSAGARTSITGTDKIQPNDVERATMTAALTAYMAIASGQKKETHTLAANGPVLMEQDNRCSGLDPLGQWSLYIPQRLDFDVLSCCQAHDEAISCNCDKSANATLKDNLKFISCVDGKATEAFKRLPWYTQIASGILFAIERALVIDLIGAAVVHIGTERSGQRGNLCGKDSCVCGGSRPTVGADPTRCKRGVDPHVCTYADYEYKMLCRGRPAVCDGGNVAVSAAPEAK